MTSYLATWPWRARENGEDRERKRFPAGLERLDADPARQGQRAAAGDEPADIGGEVGRRCSRGSAVTPAPHNSVAPVKHAKASGARFAGGCSTASLRHDASCERQGVVARRFAYGTEAATCRRGSRWHADGTIDCKECCWSPSVA